MPSRLHRPQRPQGGPPLGLLAVISTALFLSGLLIAAVVAHGFPPSPTAAATTVDHYAAAHTTSNRISAFFSFAAAIPLAIYAATANARLHTLGVRAPGATIALAGGLLSAGFLALSGLCSWVLARPEVSSNPALAHAFVDFDFVVGGPGHVAMLGLLDAGIAVPALIIGLLPRRLAISGIVVAVICELSTLTILTSTLFALLPIGRLLSLGWLIAAGFLLPTRRNNKSGTNTTTVDAEHSHTVTA
jgi:hypothetical protein